MRQTYGVRPSPGSDILIKSPISDYHPQHHQRYLNIISKALDLAADFPNGSSRLRHFVDQNKESHALLYPYYKTTLLGLISEFPKFPIVERLKILRYVTQGIKELHDKGWLHLDVKSDNILINWESLSSNSETNDRSQVVTSAVLSDFDLGLKIPHMPNSSGYKTIQLKHPVGNVQWRSPEAQTGLGLTKASDVYSFALVCLYILGTSEYLLISPEKRQQLIRENIPDELEMFVRHMCFFEPTKKDFEWLVKHMAGDETWEERLRTAFERGKRVLEKHPDQRLSCWGQEMGDEMVRLVLEMTRMDPRRRLMIGEVLESEGFELG
ncbi:protein kinase [Triangularia setosa]|uniref:Protein kinase n=1 Tax=Triangularia setosa TaxID=2587417 RepID=A0AAN6VY30_9PEZI|nr:protein kinase [Podospora setosa]